MRGRGKKKEDDIVVPTRGSRRRSNATGSVEVGEEIPVQEGVEEVKLSEEPRESEEITMDVCEDWLNESHTLLRNMLVRFNEGLTPLELDALANGLKCVELVLSDEDMMTLYQNGMTESLKRSKEEEAKKKE